MSQLKIRASQLGHIMVKPKAKKDQLSVGAKTYIEKLAIASVYQGSGVPQPSGGTPAMKKGVAVEDKAIELVSALLGKQLKKNPEFRENEWVCGTCDLYDAATNTIHDIKSSWSLLTFPALPKDGYDAVYEWQLRCYMMLWDADQAELNYCLIDTPQELHMEAEHLHLVEHLPAHMRMTRLPFKRDLDKEEHIKIQVEYARDYYEDVLKEIDKAHERTISQVQEEYGSDGIGHEPDAGTTPSSRQRGDAFISLVNDGE
jgi:hypothetical protein